MKIAFVSQPGDIIAPPKLESSIAIWTYEVARRLAQFADVIVYAKYPKKGWVKQNYDASVCYRYISISIDERLVKLLKLLEQLSGNHNPKQPLFSSRLYYSVYALQIAKDLRKQQCDIVHIFNSSQFIPIIRSFNPNIKIVLHMHCEWLSQLERTMIANRLNQADLVLSCSEYISGKIRQTFPKFADRCQTVYNGVDIKKFCPTDEQIKNKTNKTKKLLFVGRISPEKGIHILLEAFEKVIERYPETQLELVGFTQLIPYELIVALSDDPLVTKLASFYPDKWMSYLSQWQNSSIANQISFIGSVPNSELVDRYQNADVFVFPSVVNEAFGIPIIEAMATEVPVVVSRSGAFEEVVEEGKTGLIVERDDADALAEAILQLLADEQTRKTMAKAGRERVVALFTYDKVVENLLYQYKNLCPREQINVTSDRA
ncbi:glycosyltransferase family 4 protein [Pleurocapsales cyanobacterium LEGE 06147]|nr:glycosyltransferase family 4 protein [Pleurocapsales cyanobacterium LEGE 06147]